MMFAHAPSRTATRPGHHAFRHGRRTRGSRAPIAVAASLILDLATTAPQRYGFTCPLGAAESGACDELSSALARASGEPEFQQAIHEVLDSLGPLLEKQPEYMAPLARMLEPERVVSFRVAWTDDAGRERVNRGYRVQCNQALGPYKGGLRFHPSVNQSVLKFLALEQALKNSLTGMNLGAGKGGADFDPKGKSDAEVMRFCQAFMTELSRHIGPDVDVPAGDIGVGGREVGFLFGQYKRMTGRWAGALTGKPMASGGSLLRPEATGYGVVYFAEEMLKGAGMAPLAGRRAAVSGSGNVAQHAAEKLLDVGAEVVTLSDSSGTLEASAPGGLTREALALVMDLKNARRGRLSELDGALPGLRFHAGENPWRVAGGRVDVAMPCATQNELDEEDAALLVRKGCVLMAEGANMPSTPGALAALAAGGAMVGPAKAANAGGVAVSGLEMAQNASHSRWTREAVDAKLQSIMADIHANAAAAACRVGRPGDLVAGANVAGFIRVADAMLQQGTL